MNIKHTESAVRHKYPIHPIQSTAKRFANTKGISREDWLAIRKQGIGSSDAAAACGLNPYQSMLELWMIKTGRVAQPAESSTDNHYSPLYWGQQLEPLIAKFYQLKTGNKVRRINSVLQHHDADKAFMLANLDYAVVGNDDVHILECKSVGEWGTKNWRHSVPLYVLIQVQHQLAVTGKQTAHLCALICGHEAKIFTIQRNETVIAQLIEAERKFWNCVVQDIPPSVDASESSAKAIQQLYPEHRALHKVDFSEDENANTLFDDLVKNSHLIAEHQQRYDQLKHQLQMQMKDAEQAIFRSGTIYWKKSKDSTILNQKALLKDQPTLLKQYPQNKAGSRRFVVNLPN